MIDSNFQYRKLKDQDCIKSGDILVMIAPNGNMRFCTLDEGNAHIGKFSASVAIFEDGEYILRAVEN